MSKKTETLKLRKLFTVYSRNVDQSILAAFCYSLYYLQHI